ncbi:hypothetical protein [Paenibacillus aceris]|uniref:Uncharacterized protein n=1 Tax=Paenibacillus aceris TaxID=869555 RepID=A0ABS4I377_9BACL|nr:hypothetical protein [Paenibacillus aceris]MBP1965367.1 hypothetical protein [Paenibacillus aceris]NHW36049.1 hypothetical protein [Paenibacillus aceris]
MERKYGININNEIMKEARYVNECRKIGVTPEPCRCCHYLSRVDKITYKSPNYMLSCAQDFRKGERGFQQHIWQATLDDGIAVFTTHPGATQEGAGRPDLWSGNATHPRAVQHGNTVLCLYRIPADSKLPYSHAHFPRSQFDEVCEVGGWLFGRKGGGYVGLYSQHGYRWSGRADLADIEIICDALHNGWICQLGSRDEHGAFKQFVSAVLSRDVETTDGGALRYVTPDGRSMEWGWDGELLEDGEPVRISGYKRFENGYCTADRYSGVYSISQGGETLTLDFSKL